MATVTQSGPRLGIAPAWAAPGLPRATYYRRRQPARAATPRRPSPRALGGAERATVLEQLHTPRFVDLAPGEVYATLLDEGTYLCSERTMYRLLAAHAELRERRDQLRHPVYAAPELLARRPNELWSWDITKLLGPAKWTYFLSRSRTPFGLPSLSLGDAAARLQVEWGPPFILTTGNCDDSRARPLDLLPRPSRQLRRSHTREHRPASSTGGPAAIRRSTSTPAPGPVLLGLALTPLDGLAVQTCHIQARARPRLAPARLSALLALEIPITCRGSPADRRRHPNADPPHGPGQPHLGSAPDPSRTPISRL